MSVRPHESGTDRIAEVVEGLLADLVLNVQGDEPFTRREPLEKLLQAFDGPGGAEVGVASLMQELHDPALVRDPNYVKVAVDAAWNALFFSRSPIPFVRDPAAAPTFWEHIGVYAFRRDALLRFARLPAGPLERAEKVECLRFLEHGIRMRMVPTDVHGRGDRHPRRPAAGGTAAGREGELMERIVHKNLKQVGAMTFGRGALGQLDAILADNRQGAAPMVFLVDHVFHDRPDFVARIPVRGRDRIYFVDVTNEPKTGDVDSLRDRIRAELGKVSGLVGIGGGSTMDLAKAVALMLTNPGSSQDYQGWDLVQVPGVYKAGVPTLSGTGAEVSRTAVLIGPTKKLGLNSDYTPFDQVVLDPDLIAGVPERQRFFTGMDCYIHNVESLQGRAMNTFARVHAEKSLDLCREVFLAEGSLGRRLGREAHDGLLAGRDVDRLLAGGRCPRDELRARLRPRDPPRRGQRHRDAGARGVLSGRRPGLPAHGRQGRGGDPAGRGRRPPGRQDRQDDRGLPGAWPRSGRTSSATTGSGR